jgi:hypothetical protein
MSCCPSDFEDFSTYPCKQFLLDVIQVCYLSYKAVCFAITESFKQGKLKMLSSAIPYQPMAPTFLEMGDPAQGLYKYENPAYPFNTLLNASEMSPMMAIIREFRSQVHSLPSNYGHCLSAISHFFPYQSQKVSHFVANLNSHKTSIESYNLSVDSIRKELMLLFQEQPISDIEAIEFDFDDEVTLEIFIKASVESVFELNEKHRTSWYEQYGELDSSHIDLIAV